APHRGGFLVGAGEEPQRVAGVVVEDGKRMAATRADGDVTFEIHLPEGIGGRVLEALQVPCRADTRVEAVVAAEDCGDGAGRGHVGVPQRLQACPQFAATPGRVLVTQRQYRGFNRL